jgi:membrane-bound lytic murein transglycosylase D
MSLLSRPLLIGALLLMAGLLGNPGMAGSEPLSVSLSAPHPRSVEEASGGLPHDPDPLSSSVKQPGLGHSSEALTAHEAGREAGAGHLSSAPDETLAAAPLSYRVEDNARVRQFLDRFQTGDRRAVVERWLARAGRYLPMIFGVFRDKGLPEELVFTAMIESGFNPVAVSRAGAKGLWQFMAPTARRYGLRVDRFVDERLDPEKSTVAAANYLRDLYAAFGSWELAQAAYNAGEMKVSRAIRGMGSTDFWVLARGRGLRQETKDFVPAIHAATLIGREPERYGFVIAPEDPLRYELVTVSRATPLKRIATLTGANLEDLERLNSELRLKQTPPGAYALRVPAGDADRMQAALEREAAPRPVASTRAVDRAKSAAAATQPRAPEMHVVQARETISGIAKRYGVSVTELLHWNDLTETARIFPGDRLRVAVLEARAEEPEQGGFR